MKKNTAIFALILICLPFFSIANDHPRTKAESVAVSYVLNFFKGHIRESVPYLHPQVLTTFRAGLVSEIERAKRENQEAELLASFGTKLSTDDLLKLDEIDLYVEVVSANQHRAGRAADALKNVEILNVSSTPLPNGDQKITFLIMLNSPFIVRPSELVVTPTPAGWRVHSYTP